MEHAGPLAVAEGLLNQPTAPYHEAAARSWCERFAAARPELWSTTDAAGNLSVGLGDPGAERPLVLVAHLDHPGFTIDGVAGAGVSLTFHGGLAAGHAGEGAPVAFYDADGSATGQGRLVAVDDVAGRLAGATAEALGGRAVAGGFAMWDFPAWSVVDGRIVARVCDDLLGAAAVLAALDELAAAGVDAPVRGLFTRAEEVGFLGALEAIRLGTVPAGAAVVSLECSKALPDAPQGGGVIVRVGDRLSTFSPDLTASLRTAAERVAAAEPGFRHQRRLMDGGACEATAFCASGYRASGLAVPLGNYHNAADTGGGVAPETVLVDDWLAEVRLLVALGADPGLLDEATPEPPQWLQERAVLARRALTEGGGARAAHA